MVKTRKITFLQNRAEQIILVVQKSFWPPGDMKKCTQNLKNHGRALFLFLIRKRNIYVRSDHFFSCFFVFFELPFIISNLLMKKIRNIKIEIYEKKTLRFL